jgi:hypothetical protein
VPLGSTIGGAIGGALVELLTHAGKLGLQHASDYLRQRRRDGEGGRAGRGGGRDDDLLYRSVPSSSVPSSLDEALAGVPSLPSLDRLPSLEEAMGGRLPGLPSLVARGVPSGMADAGGEAPEREASGRPEGRDIAGSYADEMEDPSIACVPCTRSHLATIAGAAEEAARSGHPDVWRRNLAVVAGEALVMAEYDWTPQKMARARPDDREAIAAVQPAVREMVEGIPMAPRKLVLAWAATGEALRFAARPRPKPTDRQQVEMRMRDAEKWLNYCERAELPRHPGGMKVAPLLGEARHRLARDGYTAEALAFAQNRLGQAVVALTPAPTRQQVERLHRQAKAAMDGFYRRVLDNMRARRSAGSASSAGSAGSRTGGAGGGAPAGATAGIDLGAHHYDRDVRIPGRLVRAYFRGEPVPFDGLLGATPETVADFRRNLELLRALAIPVRERDLGEAGGPIKGAFSPATETIMLAPAAEAEDPDALYTLAHETVHALLHNRRCDVYGGVQKGRAQAELEADLATLILFTSLGLPVETEEGLRVSTANVQADIRQLEREAPPGAIERARWAAGVLEQAMRGDVAGAAARARACPKPAGGPAVAGSPATTTAKAMAAPAARTRPAPANRAAKKKLTRRSPRRHLPGGRPDYLRTLGIVTEGPPLFHVTRDINASLIAEQGVRAGMPHAEGGFAAAAAEAELYGDEDLLSEMELDEESRAREAFDEIMNFAARGTGKPNHNNATFFWNNLDAAYICKEQLERIHGRGTYRIVVVDSAMAPGPFWDADWLLSDELFALCRDNVDEAEVCAGVVGGYDDEEEEQFCSELDDIARRYYEEMHPWDGNQDPDREIICDCDIPPEAIVAILER